MTRRFLKGFFIFVCCAAVAVKTGAAPTTNITDAQILQSWGWIIAHQQDLAGIDLNTVELSTFLKGFSASLKNQPAPYDLSKISSDIETLAKDRRTKIVLARTRDNEARAKTFFSQLKQNTNVITQPDGLCYQTLTPSTGPFPKPQQTVTVHYTGRLIDGTEFVQMENYDVVFVTNRLSACLFEGLQHVRQGGAIRLFVPPPLPPGDDLRLGIPPGSAMIYDIELLATKDTTPEDVAVAVLPDAPEPPAPPPSGLSTSQTIEAWGWTSARTTPAANFSLEEYKINLLVQGLAIGIKDQPAPYDLRLIYPALKNYISDQKEKIRAATMHQRLTEMNTLFATLRNHTNVVELPDGLRYEILKPGTGPYPKTGQTVIADYTGTLINGKVFDRTDNEPLHIEIGSVNPGLNEGLQKINKGGEIKLYVPPALGFRDEDTSSVISSVPANSVLIYDITLLDLEPPPPPAK